MQTAKKQNRSPPRNFLNVLLGEQDVPAAFFLKLNFSVVCLIGSQRRWGRYTQTACQPLRRLQYLRILCIKPYVAGVVEVG